VRQLRLTLGLTVRRLRRRLLGYFHSLTQLSFLSSVLITLCLGYTTTVSQFINSKERFYAAVSQKLSIARDSRSQFSTQSDPIAPVTRWYTSTCLPGHIKFSRRLDY